MNNKTSEKIIDVFERVSPHVYTAEQLKKQGLTDADIVGYYSIRDGLNTFLKSVIDEWNALDENFIDVNAIVNKFIENRMGDLKDFPRELYETIQCILYEYFGLLKEATHPGWLPYIVKNAKNLEAGLKLFINERSKLQSKVESLPGIIKELRKIPADEKDYAVRLVLDNIKYDIKNVGYKPELLRIFERKWKNFKRNLSGKGGTLK